MPPRSALGSLGAVRIAQRISYKLGLPEKRRRRVIDEFHRLYYESPRQTWKNTYWLGVNTYKTPFDLWIYQELISTVRPELIVETGTAAGGSALYLASVCDLLGRGEVITIDTDERERRPRHDRVTYIKGSSTEPDVLAAVAERARGRTGVMVILDSDHSCDHVLSELRSYAGFVTPGSYLVVEDTNLNGHPVVAGFGPGPMEAVEKFLRERTEFVTDRDPEKFFFTFNPRGYLRRKES
jgi:cephalosporin hydroxylase